MKIRLTILRALGILTMVLMVKVSSGQQDPMFTQYMFNIQAVNPAYAGTWDDLGFLALARQQWAGIEGAPITYNFSMQSIVEKKWVALGLNILSDQIGKEKKFGVFGDYSYLLLLSDKTNLRLGLRAGFSNYTHHLTEYVLGDNIPDNHYAADLETRFLPNFGLGAFLYQPTYYVGFSIPKMIQNRITDNNGKASSLTEVRHFFLNAGFVFTLSEDLKFKPTFLTKLTLGAPVEFDFTANFLLREKIWLGAMYRTGASAGFIGQWIFDGNLRIGYAIDFSLSALRPYQKGTHEIVVTFEPKVVKKKYISPRYF